MPMTLNDFYEERRDGLLVRRDDAQSDLTIALADFAVKQDDHQQALAETGDKADEIDATRQAMAVAPTPVDAEALAEALRVQIIEERGLRAALLDAEQALAEVKREKERASGELKAAESELEAAESDIDDAEERQQRHDDWVAALAKPPLSTLAADATAALAGADFTAAKARTDPDADLPAKLRTRALERRTRQQERLTEAGDLAAHAVTQHDDQRDDDGGVEGDLAALWTDFLNKEGAFGDYVRQARYRFDLAEQHLRDVIASPTLTAEQKALIDDATLKLARDAAADAEKDYYDALKDVELERKKLEEERLVEKAKDVDLTDAQVDANGNIPTILGNLALLEPILTAAESALDTSTSPPDPTPRRELDLWEAAAPEHIWDNLAAFAEAVEILTELAAGPGTLKLTMETAEDALYTALKAHDKSERARDMLTAAVEDRRQRRDYAAEVQSRRIASEVRGDR